MNETFAPQSNARLAIVAPFLILIASCLALMIAALSAYGIADDFGYDSWAPTAGAYLFAVPVMAGSLAFNRATWLKTMHTFRINRLRFLFGLAAVASVIALTIAYVVLVNDPASYRSDKIDPLTRTYEANLTQESFLSFSFLMAVFFPCGGLAFVAKVMYLDAIQAVGLTRPAGIDPMGEIMRSDQTERHRPA